MARKPSMDGFIPRRSPGTLGEPVYNDRRLPKADITGFQRRELKDDHPEDERPADSRLTPSIEQGLTRADVDESLRGIDQEPEPKHAGKKPPRKSPKRNYRKIIKRVVIGVAIVLALIGLWVGIKTLIASNSVFKGDIFGLIQQKKLKEDSGGRTNILIFGTSEDDPGHEAPYLTDSILVLSVNQTKKDAYMFSIPRDLEVQYDGCPSAIAGGSGKINVVYGCYYNNGKAEEAGAKALIKQVGAVTGLDIPYYAHVNYSVVRDVVKALGTITVNIEGSGGAPGVMDSNFDWKCKGGNEYASLATMKSICPPNGHFIDYPNGPAKLDAEHALYLAQARGDRAPTYGLGNSNFDREKNQQKIIVAIKEKALSTGTLTNIGKVTGLIDAVGKNLRTNFETSEIRTLMSLGNDLPNEAIQRISLLDNDILTGNAQPTAGKFNFTQVQAFIKKKLYATGISKEDAHIIILNASGVPGAAQTAADKLTALGMTIDAVDNAPTKYTKNTLYRVKEPGKPKTAAKLESLYGVKPEIVESVPGIRVGDETTYVLILVDVKTETDTSTSQ